MGACRPGDIRDLCGVAQPEVGVITGIAPAHMEQFGGIEEIIQTTERSLSEKTREIPLFAGTVRLWISTRRIRDPS